ncbi:putative thylakoid soluble phosphoprotein TSP9 [Medicago truncatula]|uniref:Putative thylakoid soluble phosphoprotein TSP9 n=1 Tax=Medicago truncatula TaxID=3880 RepID=G7K6C4_MEDTR|nr:uncharacterized protein LOC11411948 [Medicago truncatula]AES98562.1 thylakoid soluble phosphoprotein TSP9 protein [Medicago truncatula]RHN56451.1 putative thylakoid soluble phosphoprotein TSP9 [Medicago truncatula]
MASITMLPMVPTTGRVFAATGAKGTTGGGSSKQEKGFWDWIVGGLTKEDQFYETDPILKKVEEKNNSRGTTSRGTTSGKGTTSGGKNSVVVPQKKKGGFGGFFNKD